MQCFTPSWASALITQPTHSNPPHQKAPPHMQHILEQQPKANSMPTSTQSSQLTLMYPTADKALTLIVDPSTRAGAMGEHSPCDVLVPSVEERKFNCERRKPVVYPNE